MTDVKPGQTWEVYSDSEGCWKRAIVTEVKGDEVLLHYEGLLDFISVPFADLKGRQELYRQAERTPPSC